MSQLSVSACGSYLCLTVYRPAVTAVYFGRLSSSRQGSGVIWTLLCKVGISHAALSCSVSCHAVPCWTGPHCELSTSVRVWKASSEALATSLGCTETSSDTMLMLWVCVCACVSEMLLVCVYFRQSECVPVHRSIYVCVCVTSRTLDTHIYTQTLKQADSEIENKCDKTEGWKREGGE